LFGFIFIYYFLFFIYFSLFVYLFIYVSIAWFYIQMFVQRVSVFAKSAHCVYHVSPSVRMFQRGYRWADLREGTSSKSA
jgi:hypothetical protein